MDCLHCSVNCCSHFILPLSKKEYESFSKDFPNHPVKIFPNFALVEAPCPYFKEGVGCARYETRFRTCRSFPVSIIPSKEEMFVVIREFCPKHTKLTLEEVRQMTNDAIIEYTVSVSMPEEEYTLISQYKSNHSMDNLENPVYKYATEHNSATIYGTIPHPAMKQDVLKIRKELQKLGEIDPY